MLILDLPTQLGYCYRNWRGGNVLLVLDDVENYQQIEEGHRPHGTRFKVLITTRERFSTVISLDLDVLTPEAALELLISLGGKERFTDAASQQLASQLCEWLGYLPLGLELVGRYLAKRRISLTEILSRLQARRINHKSLDEATPGMTATKGVKAAFELSWNKKCLSVARNRLGEEHPSVATSLNNLAETYRNQGKYQEAEKYHLQALAIAEKRLGENHPYTVLFRKNLQYLRKKL